MRAVVLRSLLVIGTGALILGGVLYVASTVDGRPPGVARIALTQPLPDAPTRALSTTSIEVAFSEAVEPGSAAAALVLEPPIEGSVSWSGPVMTFTPADPLDLSTEYRVSVREGVVDLAGNRMTELPPPFAFETLGPPAVTETAPADGATDVTLEGPITITFSTLMDTASVESSLRLRPSFAHELRWSGQILEIVPDAPLRPDADYRVDIGDDAFDVSGVALESPVRIGFRTVTQGLATERLVPADESDGIVPTTPIAVFFDRAIDADTLPAEPLVITPEVAGSFDLVDALAEEPESPEDGRVLRFTPSGALPANTTFEVAIAPEIGALGGGAIGEPVTWSFTTGAPPQSVSNQITFISDIGGVPNLWAMNPDGTAAHQLSSELTPVLDYAIAPDGNTFVVGDGRRLILVDAVGTDRRVLTEEGVVEFDPTYAPNGSRIAFARADADGTGLGIWEHAIPGDSASRVEVDAGATPDSTVSASADGASSQPLRAPRYSPDGEAIAYVDVTGSVGIVELGTGDVVDVTYSVQAPPLWLPNGDGVLLTGADDGELPDELTFDTPVAPLEPEGGDLAVGVLERDGGSVRESGFGRDVAAVATALDGRVAHLGGDGSLRVSATPDDRGTAVRALRGERVTAVAFAPGEDAIVVVLATGEDPEVSRPGRIERVMLATDEREILANRGWRARWLP